MINKKIGSILILIVCVSSIWAFVFIYLMQDGSTSIEQHAYSDTIHPVKEILPINLTTESNEPKSKITEIDESIIDLHYIVAKKESNKVSIDTILAAITREYKE